jgi:small conductance mechanosensitive channel
MQFADLIAAPTAWLGTHTVQLLSAAAVLIGCWYLSKFLYRTIRNLLPQAYGIDRNFAPLLAQAARYGTIVFGIVTALSFVGVSSASIYAVLGAAGLAVALALQGTLSNIAAGIMLIWLRPIAIGEYITGDGVAGVVVEIGLFGTRLRSTSGLYIFTPNTKLWNSAITNHSREPRRRIDVNINVPDSIDLGKARRAMLKIATSDKRVQVDPPPTVHVETFVGDRIILQLRAWVPTDVYLDALRDATEQAKIAVNRLLAGAGETVEVSVAADPHTIKPGEKTPDLT